MIFGATLVEASPTREQRAAVVWPVMARLR
jgi:hypothetical protein